MLEDFIIGPLYILIIIENVRWSNFINFQAFKMGNNFFLYDMSSKGGGKTLVR